MLLVGVFHHSGSALQVIDVYCRTRDWAMPSGALGTAAIAEGVVSSRGPLTGLAASEAVTTAGRACVARGVGNRRG